MSLTDEAERARAGLQGGLAVHYEDFSIVLGPPRDGEYPVSVRSPAGEGGGTFRVPFSDGELRTLRERITLFVRRVPGAPGPQPSAVSGTLDPREVGDKLFRALFSGEVEKLLERSLERISGKGELEAQGEGEAEQRGLRIRLGLAPGREGSAHLVSLPWEVMYWSERRLFLSLGRQTPLVRFLEIPLTANRVPVRLPLRILAVASRAGDPPLNVEDECARLRAACAGIPDVKLTILPEATPGALRRALHEERYHVLHFLGHGIHPPSSAEGALLFEREGGSGDILLASAFAEMIRDVSSLRLVALTACESARMPHEPGPDPFAGVASALLLAGLPAVVAMQYRVSGDAADLFTEAFYRRLAAGDPVEAATAEGRLAVHLRDSNSAEWATPVLFLRAPDGRLVEPHWGIPEPIRSLIVDRSTYIADKTRDFVGRRWIFDAIDQFTASQPRGYFVLRGDPGIGKSALIARMVQDGGHVHHFNIRAEGNQKPDAFLRNVCAQLIAKYDLGLSSVPAEATQDSRFLSSLLDKVSAGLPQGGRALLLVDALDESDLPADANPLFLPVTLPSGVFIVATSRRPGRTGPHLTIQCEQQLFDIEQDAAGNVADVRSFVESKLPLAGIRAYIGAQGLDDETFVIHMVGKSQGNFMYLRHVLPEIERGVYKDRSFDTLPLGLQGYYEDQWRRMRARNETAWFKLQLPVLVALTVVKEPVSMNLLKDFSDVADRVQIRTVLQDWDQFLYTAEVKDEQGHPEKRYRIYHESFHDFIASKDEVADERVSLQQAHGRIADVLWRELYGEG